MQSRTLARELALLMLGQTNDRVPAADLSLETLLQQAMASLSQHVRESLDRSAEDLQGAQQQLLDSELQDSGEASLPKVRQHLQQGIAQAEQALNRLSASLELPRLLLLSDQDDVRRGALERAREVLRQRRGRGCPARWRDGGLAPRPPAPHRPRHPAPGGGRPAALQNAACGGRAMRRWNWPTATATSRVAA